jgi:hypothetical protein
MTGNRLTIGLGVCAFGALVCAAGGAAAQEYCVACTGPDALYRCVIEGARPGGAQPLQVLCLTAMAKEGGHATCSIKRGTVFQCDGKVKRVPFSDDAQSPPNGVAATAKAKLPGEAAAPAGTQREPQTVVELAKRAGEATGEQMKKAQEDMKTSVKTTGNAAKKAWDCLISFFTRC